MMYAQACSPQRGADMGQQSKALTSWWPNSPKDLPFYMTKADPPLPGQFLQRHRALCRPQSLAAKLGKYSSTESMLNPHLSQLHCFQSPIHTAQRELGM